MTAEIRSPKKLIETALPLGAINVAAAREKSIRHGHPSTLHLWWARRPLAAARAIIFAQMVNDPGYERHLGRGVNRSLAIKEREKLFGIIERLVQWENINNEEVLNEARTELLKSWRDTCALNREHPDAKELFNPNVLPGFFDPFAGGGAIPLEAQRLGLDAIAADLNPVAVTINKAMIEIPPRFCGQAPVGPVPQEEDSLKLLPNWEAAKGLAEDVRRYGKWVRDEAFKRIGHLYPSIEIAPEAAEGRSDLSPLVGKRLPVIAWIWGRTVKSPNPAFSHVDVPLVSTFVLANREGREVYIEPRVTGANYNLKIKIGVAPEAVKSGTKLARGAKFRCLVSSTPIEPKYVYDQANAKKMGLRLLAVVAQGPEGRVYVDADDNTQNALASLTPKWSPDLPMPENPRWFSPPLYGLKTYGDLFTPRQLVFLNTLSDLVQEAVAKCRKDAVTAGLPNDDVPLEEKGRGARAYSEAVGIYLALGVDKTADYNSSLVAWSPSRDQAKTTFSRQALPMIWDFAEVNPFAGAAGDFNVSIQGIVRFLDGAYLGVPGRALQADATVQTESKNKVVSTDPPYYDNIGYADLSDFFYVWLRRSLERIIPRLFSQPEAPKAAELVATPYRHGGKSAAEAFFLNGMKATFSRLAETAHPAFPITIYYAFKQSETDEESGTTSTGWETFLEGVLRAGLTITGTWPIRTERDSRSIGIGTNALASSVVLVCRKRSKDAPSISRREFIRELNAALPDALEEMTTGQNQSPVAPVDLSQAIIGPGMAIFSKYSAVLEADGNPMPVKTALQLINRFVSEDDFDHDTQFCLSWFEAHGWTNGKFGEADVLARAKGTSVDGLRDGGVVESAAGSLRLLKPVDLPGDWAPEKDSRLSIWEILHHMIRRFNAEGEAGAGEILAKTNQYAETIRRLAYRLYTICERKGWAQEATVYNSLVQAWEPVEAAAQSVGFTGTQISLFGDEKSGSTEDKSPKKRARKK